MITTILLEEDEENQNRFARSQEYGHLPMIYLDESCAAATSARS